MGVGALEEEFHGQVWTNGSVEVAGVPWSWVRAPPRGMGKKGRVISH